MPKQKIIYQLRCIDFVSSDYKDNDFNIKIYGIDKTHNVYCLNIDDFKPFFYIKVGDDWDEDDMDEFMKELKETYKDDYGFIKGLNENIYEMKMVRHKTLYKFDAHKYYNFIYISCNNISLFYKFKNLYYDKDKQKLKRGIEFNGVITELYETMIPPMLRFFHIQNISPSGWIEVRKYKKIKSSSKNKKPIIELNVNYDDIISLNNKEDVVPYKICSFDIEASSSHGDFPDPKKNYRKVAYDIIQILKKSEEQNIDNEDNEDNELFLKQLLMNVFQFDFAIDIDNCFLKKKDYTLKEFNIQFDKFINYKHALDDDNLKQINQSNALENYLDVCEGNENTNIVYDNDDDDDNINKKKMIKSKKKNIKTNTILEIIENKEISYETKLLYLLEGLNKHFPRLESDYVTFIGSTFVTYGEEDSYLNHCICLEDTTNIDDKFQTIECYDNEKDVLLAWTNLIQREDPDIIIGYNIFGFDYPFMYDRAVDNNCVEDFMKLSRSSVVKEELSETSIILASGSYDLKYPYMEGRLQIDVFTYMRKEFILPSYKLDYVSSYLISDNVISFENINDNCKIITKNIKGISLNCFVHFEIINHSNDIYEDGKKFKVIEITNNGFIIQGNLNNIENKKIKWGLAKDDVTPQDIFRMTNEGPDQKGIIAKYCIQDCNLVHQIFQKIDIMTTYIEMSKICSVPISFLMLRGQGIKLTSYIAKKCREKDTLMPLISKGNNWDMYEGAIVLDPKEKIYLDEPVACVDYSSLYPSSIISENLCHSSKVWTKTYDLYDTIIGQTGEKNMDGTYKYDNLDGYKYVDVKYDTFSYKRTTATAAAKKVLTGYKICRFAQFPDGEKAIMPSILEELLQARKATKKQMKNESDPFMQNILDKRQLSIKVTANSLYGQTGAKTSTFYEMDVAAATTATGRKLLIYAKDIIENVYKNLEVSTKYGKMITNAEYVYGDTDSVFFKFNLTDLDGNKVLGKKALEITIDLAKEAGEIATKFLKKPHDLEYEKTFMPWILLSKKRYVGILYEEDPNKGKRKSMGIVLKRRDNAPIVKDVYGGIIDIIMNEQNIQKSIEFLDNSLKNIVNENISIEKLIISKSLRSFYKKPEQIAHKVLADRMGERDPGNKPRPGDRIPYVYILTNKKKDLQGNKIESPQFIKENKTRIDYGFYISNQIMKPVIQIYALVLDEMSQFQRKKNNFNIKIKTLQQNMDDVEKLKKKFSN